MNEIKNSASGCSPLSQTKMLLYRTAPPDWSFERVPSPTRTFSGDDAKGDAVKGMSCKIEG